VRQIGSHTGARFQGAVFHRAFDFTHDPKTALEALVDVGFRRVMTSGGQPTALPGASVIWELITQAANRIEVLPAGGIRGHNVAELIARTGCTQVHASVTQVSPEPVSNSGPDLPVCEVMAPSPPRMSRPLLGELADALSAHRTYAAIPRNAPTPAAGNK
jgi:copper homeostasis protein CutC